jgi:hypothetical protein
MAEKIVINVNPKATYRRPGQISRRFAVLSKPNAPLSYRPKVVSRTKAVLAKRKTSARQRVNTKMIGKHRKVWSKHRKNVSQSQLDDKIKIYKEEIQIKKKIFKKPNYANKQIMGLNATFDKNTQTPGTQFPSNPFESVAGSGSMMVGFGGGIPGPSIVAPNEKEKNYMPKKTFSKFKKELVKEGGFVDAPGYDGSPTQDGPSMGTVSARVTIDSPSPKNKKMKKKNKVEEAMTPGRKKLFSQFLKPSLDAMGNTAAKLQKNADDYAAVVKKYPAKPSNEEHTKCGTDDCCGECK